MAKCYGWLKLNASLFKAMPRDLAVRVAPRTITVSRESRSLSPNTDHVAIVYEYIEDGVNDRETIDNVGSFLWHTGFSHCLSPLLKNWKSSVLVDYSDIVHAEGYAWSLMTFGMSAIEVLFNPLGGDSSQREVDPAGARSRWWD